MTLAWPASDRFSGRLLADARDGIEQYRQLFGPLRGDVLDLGAHFGMFALQTLEAGASRAICVEASSANYAALMTNVLANDLAWRAVTLHAAAWEGPEKTIALHQAVRGNSGQYSVMFDGRHPVSDTRVPTIPFTTLLRLSPAWAYVKCDVEGAEWSLLNRGDEAAEVFLRNVQLLDLELHPLDNREYYGVHEQIHHGAEVADWFRKHGGRVLQTDAHPTRIYVMGTRA